jgi:hypothetical protein
VEFLKDTRLKTSGVGQRPWTVLVSGATDCFFDPRTIESGSIWMVQFLYGHLSNTN